MRRPAFLTLTIVAMWTVGGLVADRHVGRDGQLLLGLLTSVVLVGVLLLHPPCVRYRALGVVCVATAGEVVGSLVWGLYGYRLDNLPAFVPPGHGLVYLAGASVAALARARTVALLAAAAAGAAAWGTAGIALLDDPDAAGAIGCACLIAVLGVTRRPVYAAMFLVVAALELYGTALGTWTWESEVPGLGLSQGNPPSGVASGYVLFDVLALALVDRVLRRRARAVAQSRSARSTSAATGSPARIRPRASSTLPQTSQRRNPRGLPASST